MKEMKRGFMLILVCLLFASVFFMSVLSAEAGVCSGTPTASCADYRVSRGSDDVLRCRIPGCVSSSSPPQLYALCSGTPTPCASFTSGDLCSTQPGCSWVGIVNGVCSTTTVNTCDKGVLNGASTITETASLATWSCAGSGGGTTAQCSKEYPKAYVSRGVFDGHLEDYDRCSFDGNPATSQGGINQIPTEEIGEYCYDWVGLNYQGYRSAKFVVTPVFNGICSTAVENYCDGGTFSSASTITETASLATWSCAGSGGGTTVQCSKAKLLINGECSAPDSAVVVDTCFAGEPMDVGMAKDTNTEHKWSCAGTGGGTTEQCSKLKSDIIPSQTSQKLVIVPSSGDGISVRESDDQQYGVNIFSTDTLGYVDVYASGQISSHIQGFSDSYLNVLGGKVGIGKVNPAYKLDVAGAVGATDFLYTSDIILKENIRPLEGSLSKILELQGVSFNWKENGEGNIGLIAQDVEKIYPELVSTSVDGIKSVKYGNLVAPLIEAAKEQNKRIDEQQKQIDELKREIERLKDDPRWL